MKNNQRNSDKDSTFSKVYKSGSMMIYDDLDIALWQRIFNFILLEVEFEQGYFPTCYVKKLSEYFKTDSRNIHAAITKLVTKTWLLKYPYGAKRAKGYVINPEHFWVGTEESKHQKIKMRYNSMNKLKIDIDIRGESEVEVNLVNDKAIVRTNYIDLEAA